MLNKQLKQFLTLISNSNGEIITERHCIEALELLKIGEEDKITLEKHLNKLKNKAGVLISKHWGKEHKFTYWGGWDLGYVKGKISVLEDLIDE